MFRNEILSIKKSFDEDRVQKAGMYAEIEASSTIQQRLIETAQVHIKDEGIAWRTLLEICSVHLNDSPDKLQCEQILKIIAASREKQMSADAYMRECV